MKFHPSLTQAKVVPITNGYPKHPKCYNRKAQTCNIFKHIIKVFFYLCKSLTNFIQSYSNTNFLTLLKIIKLNQFRKIINYIIPEYPSKSYYKIEKIEEELYDRIK